jgi:glutaredoxin
MSPLVPRRPRYQSGVRVTLYHSPGCHLCDDAREVLRAVQQEQPFELDEVDITGDDALESEYRELLPVVQVEGGPRFCWFVPPDALRRALDAQTGS